MKRILLLALLLIVLTACVPQGDPLPSCRKVCGLNGCTKVCEESIR